jgi:thioredoxin reductase (NADPH)
MLDCLVIGGGPAGLTAGLYLARFKRSFVIVDAGAPRAAAIPKSHNIPFFPEGISGVDMIARQRETLLRYADSCCLVQGRVVALSRSGNGFYAQIVDNPKVRNFETRRVILATGAQDVEIALPGLKDAVQRGIVRYCPICDGYEACDQKIGVIARGARGLSEAAFIARTYGVQVTVLTLGEPLQASSEELNRAQAQGVKIQTEPVQSLDIGGNGVAALCFASGDLHLDTLYSALGLEPRSELAATLGATRDESGALKTDKHQQTSIQGLYAVGGVAEGLDQIVIAMGHAAIAATHVHNHCEDSKFPEPVAKNEAKK